MMKFLQTFAFAILLSLPFGITVHAATGIVLKLEGIEGDSQVAGHTKEIDISSMSFSVEQALALKEAGKGGATAAKAEFTPITLLKTSDKSSPFLFINSALGKLIKTAKITFYIQNDGPGLTELFTIALTGVTISKFEVSAASGDDVSQESISINYATIVMTFTPFGGQPVSAGFDVRKNVSIGQ